MIRVSDLGWREDSSGKSGPIWSKSSAIWFINEGIQYFYIWPLFVNIAVAFSLSLSVVFLWHLHCLVNPKPWLTNVKEVVVVTLTVVLLLSTVLVAIQILRNKYDDEMTFLAELEKENWGLGMTSDDLPWYLRPLKELGIIKEEDFEFEYRGIVWPSKATWTQKDLDKETENINDVLAKLAAKRSPLTFVHSVVIVDQRLNFQGIQSLCKLVPYCTDLYIGDYLPNITDQEIAYLTSHLKNLHALGLYGAKLSDESVLRFATMHKLNNLAFDDSGKTTTNAGLKSLLALPHIRCLGIPVHWSVTNEEKENIMRHGPRVDFITPEED